MNTLDNLFKSDENKSVKGVPIVVGTNQNGDDVVFYIAEIGNPNHDKVQRRYSKQLERYRKREELQQQIIVKIVAESILVDWEGVLDDDGQHIEATLENKIAALTKYRKLFVEVMQEAGDPSNFALVDDDVNPEEDTEKN